MARSQYCRYVISVRLGGSGTIDKSQGDAVVGLLVRDWRLANSKRRASEQRRHKGSLGRSGSGRCEVIEIQHACVRSARENLLARQIEEIQQRGPRRLTPPLRERQIIAFLVNKREMEDLIYV